MSVWEDFLAKYTQPQMERIIVGFSGIDSEALNKLIDERVEARIQEYIKHIDCGEVNSNSDADSSSSEDTNTNTDSNP